MEGRAACLAALLRAKANTDHRNNVRCSGCVVVWRARCSITIAIIILMEDKLPPTTTPLIITFPPYLTLALTTTPSLTQRGQTALDIAKAAGHTHRFCVQLIEEVTLQLRVSAYYMLFSMTRYVWIRV